MPDGLYFDIIALIKHDMFPFLCLNHFIVLIYSTIEDDILVDQVDSPEVIDDFELGHDEVVDIKDKDVNKQKLRRRIKQYKVCLPLMYSTQIAFSISVHDVA